MVRKPVVSGKFYPQNSKDLKKLLDGFKVPESSKCSARAIILPHAGYVYSGKVAATTVSKVIPKKRIIILGNNHTGLGEGFALYPANGSWEMPFGRVAIDEELAKMILKEADGIKEDYVAHEYEHSIEVELPVLYYYFGDFRFVAIACQEAGLLAYRKIASQIYEAIKMIKEDILLIASSDMTHYEPDATARAKDSLAIEAIVNLDEEELLKKTHSGNITMCGVAPVAILLSCVKLLGARKAHVALYQTSADASGDSSSVVGYAGIIIN
ncbi:MAG: AmmeMemoRadiSam system protein B [Candidatus Omnitrophica bacterium]|nr:AmmeMemoRadiSam system protein B [Candidatus Omnitrophota bacterium]